MQSLEMKEYLSVPEVCQYFNISKSTVHKYSSQGLIPKHKPFGKHIFFRWDDIVKLFEKSRIPSNEEVKQDALNRLFKTP